MAATRSKKGGKAGPRGRGKGIHAPPGEDAFVEMLAKVAVRSLCGAISGDAKLTRRVQANGKFTPEYRRLRAMDVPPEVRAWIRDQCWEPGPVLDAVRSQLAIALERHRCEAPHYRIPSVEVRPGPGTTHHDPLLQLPCEPWH